MFELVLIRRVSVAFVLPKLTPELVRRYDITTHRLYDWALANLTTVRSSACFRRYNETNPESSLDSSNSRSG